MTLEAPPLFTDGELVVIGILLTIIFGMSLMFLGYWRNRPLLLMFSGLVWLYGSITSMWCVLADGTVPFVVWGVFCLGLGLFLLYSAGLDLAYEGDG